MRLPPYTRRPTLIAALGALAMLSVLAWSRTSSAITSPSSSAAELVREARAHEARRADDLAARRYTEALGLDPTSEDAYLGLGALRMRMGDAREAERVYAVALSHVPSLRRALEGRARALRVLDRRADAAADLEAYALLENDVAAWKELAGWYGEDGRAPAQLATWRRLVVLADRGGDAALGREARRKVKALQIVIGSADPVAAPFDTNEARRTMAAMAKRGGT